MNKLKIVAWLAALVVLATAVESVLLAADPKPKAGKLKGALTKVATVDVGGTARGLCLVGDRAYVATGDGLAILDISKIDAPKKLGSVAAAGTNQGIAVIGKHAFLANQNQGLVVVDIANEAAPKVVTSKPMTRCWAVAVKDNAAYALSSSGALHVFDVSNPVSPSQVSKFGLPGWRGEASGGQLQALKSNTGTGGTYKTGVSVSGDRMVAVDWAYGRIYLYDVSTATKPVFKGTHFAPYLLQAKIGGDAIFGLGAYRSLSGVYSVKLSELSPDKSTSYLKCPTCHFVPSGPGGVDQGGLGVSESGKHIFWYGGKLGQFHVLDVSNPSKMKEVASDEVSGHRIGVMGVLDLVSRGEHIFVCAGAKGVVVYRFPGL